LQVYGDGPFRRLQGASRRKEVLGVVAPYYLGKPEKGPTDGLYVATLWGRGGLRARPEGVPGVGKPQEKELCAGLLPLSIMTTDQVDAARYFREVFDWDLP
jgi:hypothetical protein